MNKSYELDQELNQGVIEIEFSPEEVKTTLKKVYRANAKDFSAPGFRKGRVPFEYAMSLYGEASFYDQVFDELVNSVYGDIVKEYEFEPVASPEVEDIAYISSEEGLKCTLRVDLKPIPKLGQYLGVEAYKPEVKVSKEDVEHELSHIQERNARMISVDDRAAQEDDTVNIDYKGSVAGEYFEGGTAEAQDLVLGSGSFIPGFEEQIVGHEIGDEFEVEVTFPEEYHAEDLAGQDAIFEVKLNSISYKQLPELDDEFAMDVSEFDTIEEYREALETELLEQQEEHAKNTYENNLIQNIVANAEVVIPDSLLEEETRVVYRQNKQRMKEYFGFSDEQFDQFFGMQEESMLLSAREEAQMRLETQFVIEKIRDEENITLTEEEKAKTKEDVKAEFNFEDDEIFEQVPNLMDYYYDQAVLRKTLEFLFEKGIPTDVAPEIEVDLPEDASDEEAEENGAEEEKE